MKKLIDQLSRMGCISYIVYDEDGTIVRDDIGDALEEDAVDDYDEELEAEMNMDEEILENQGDNRTKKRTILIKLNDDSYYCVENKCYYDSMNIYHPKLDMENFNRLREVFYLLGDTKLEINSLLDLKKVYASNILKELDNCSNDVERIEFIVNQISDDN